MMWWSETWNETVSIQCCVYDNTNTLEERVAAQRNCNISNHNHGQDLVPASCTNYYVDSYYVAHLRGAFWTSSKLQETNMQLGSQTVQLHGYTLRFWYKDSRILYLLIQQKKWAGVLVSQIWYSTAWLVSAAVALISVPSAGLADVSSKQCHHRRVH